MTLSPEDTHMLVVTVNTFLQGLQPLLYTALGAYAMHLKNQWTSSGTPPKAP